jgi:hypothetical protein
MEIASGGGSITSQSSTSTSSTFTVSNTGGDAFLRVSGKPNSILAGAGDSVVVNISISGLANETKLRLYTSASWNTSRALQSIDNGDNQEFTLTPTGQVGYIGFTGFNTTTEATVTINSITVTGKTGFVRTWYDQSGSDNHAVQTDTAKQPKIVEDGNLLKDSNNNPEVRFDGSDDELVADSLASSFSGDAIPISAFSVSEVSAASSEVRPVWRFENSSTGNPLKQWQYRSSGYGIIYRADSGTNINDLNAGPYSVNEEYLHTIIVNNSEVMNGYENGTLLSQIDSLDANIGQVTLNEFRIAPAPYGKLREIIIYDSDQSDKRRAIEENIANHYNISLAAFSRDGTVKTWYDQSGSTPANDATQTDPTKQPKIVVNGNLLEDGIDFDSGTNLPLSGTGLNIFKNVSYGQIFSTIKPRETGTGSDRYFEASVGVGVGARFLFADGQDTAGTFRIGGRRLNGDSFGDEESPTGHSNQLSLLTGFLNYADAEGFLFLDGAQVATNSIPNMTAGNTSDTSSQSIAIGGIAEGNTASFNAKEFIIYTTDQTDNRTAIEANIGETYGITDIPAADDTVNGYVQTWYDQSGSGNDAEQISATKQPKIVGEVTSGQPHAFLGALVFDGSDNYLTNAAVGSALSGTDRPASSFFVGEPSNSTGNRATWSIGNSSSSTQFAEPYYYDGTYWEYYYRDDTGTSKSGTNIIEKDSGQLLMSHTSTGLVNNIWQNGSQIVTNGDIDLGATTTNLFTIGALGRNNFANFFNGTISELIIYSSDQSSNRPAIETNIANQYGITLS